MGISDVWVGLVMLGFAASAYWLTGDFPKGEGISTGLGPAFFPRIILIGMFILGLVVMIRGFLTRNKPSEFNLNIKDLRTPVLLLVMTGLLVLFMHFFGFLISTPLFLIVAMLFWKISWLKSLAISVGLSAVLFLLFKVILRIQLPAGTLFGGM